MALILLLCFFAGELTRMTPFQSCILARDSGRSGEMSEEQRNREVKRRLQELKREEERRRRDQEFRRNIAKRWPESAQERKQLWIQSDQRRKERKKEREEAGGRRLLQAKDALRVPEEQWKLILPKLEKVINLWDQANSTIGAGISSNSQTAIVPKIQWEKPWKYKPLFELTEAQRLARQIRILLEKKDTSPQVFRRKVTALRKARSEQAEIRKQLVKARRELREILTTRQEAILVLLGWL